MKKKACSKCKIFVDEPQCPLCNGKQFSTTWKGRIHILDTEKSEIGKKLEVEKSGEYAIKV